MLNPLSPAKWNYRTAAHLLNRAGFGGPPAEIEKLVALGPLQAVDSLVFFERVPDVLTNPTWAEPDPNRVDQFLAFRKMAERTKGDISQDERRALEEKRREMQRQEQREQQQRIMELRGWWLKRMAEGPRPLQEKLTSFGTGISRPARKRCSDAYFMWLQNDTFRGMGAWQLAGIALRGGAKIPRCSSGWIRRRVAKQHPNENFAREVMELFSLGRRTLHRKGCDGSRAGHDGLDPESRGTVL